MRIDAGVTRSASQILVLLVRNVQMSARIAVLFCQAKVNHIDLVATLSIAHQKIVWFDVAV